MPKLENKGYVPANPYQCPTNFIKPEPCSTCNEKPVCEEKITVPADAIVVGFRHTQWVSDDCVDVGDGVVKFNCGPIDMSSENITCLHLIKAISSELRKHDIPECQRLNSDITTKILQCETILSYEVNEDGSCTITHRGQESITALVVQDGEDIVTGTRACITKNVYTYEGYFETESLTVEEIQTAITQAGFTYSSVTIDPSLIPANGETPAQDKVAIETCDSPFNPDLPFNIDLCGEDCIYVSDETEDDSEKKSKEVSSSSRNKQSYIDEAKSLGIETKDLTVSQLKKAIEEKKAAK